MLSSYQRRIGLTSETLPGAEFLEAASYEHVMRWAKEIDLRKAVSRGRMVNRMAGKPERQLRERHDTSDFDNKTQDKIEAAGLKE